MTQPLRKTLEDIAFELRGIKHVLSSMWHSRYKNDDTDQVSPEFFADEYISTEECARRLGVTDQTIRNWILVGRKEPDKGWIQLCTKIIGARNQITSQIQQNLELIWRKKSWTKTNDSKSFF